jgi:hypothetical protein
VSARRSGTHNCNSLHQWADYSRDIWSAATCRRFWLRDAEIAPHPEGMPEGSQGKRSAAPGIVQKNHRLLEGRKTNALVSREMSRGPSGRRDSSSGIPGASLRSPLATVSHPFGMP